MCQKRIDQVMLFSVMLFFQGELPIFSLFYFFIIQNFLHFLYLILLAYLFFLLHGQYQLLLEIFLQSFFFVYWKLQVIPIQRPIPWDGILYSTTTFYYFWEYSLWHFSHGVLALQALYSYYLLIQVYGYSVINFGQFQKVSRLTNLFLQL